MSGSPLPRTANVSAGTARLTLQVRWTQGDETLVNVSSMIDTFRLYAPLRDDLALVRAVRVGDHGTDVVWTDAIDMAADTLWRLAREQAGETLTPAGSRA